MTDEEMAAGQKTPLDAKGLAETAEFDADCWLILLDHDREDDGRYHIRDGIIRDTETTLRNCAQALRALIRPHTDVAYRQRMITQLRAVGQAEAADMISSLDSRNCDIDDHRKELKAENASLRSQVEDLRDLANMVVEKHGEIVLLDMKIDGQYVYWLDRRAALLRENL